MKNVIKMRMHVHMAVKLLPERIEGFCNCKDLQQKNPSVVKWEGS